MTEKDSAAGAHVGNEFIHGRITGGRLTRSGCVRGPSGVVQPYHGQDAQVIKNRNIIVVNDAHVHMNLTIVTTTPCTVPEMQEYFSGLAYFHQIHSEIVVFAKPTGEGGKCWRVDSIDTPWFWCEFEF